MAGVCFVNDLAHAPIPCKAAWREKGGSIVSDKIALIGFAVGIGAIAASGAIAQSATTYAYDARGRLTAVRDGTGYRANYAHDAADNRTAVSTVRQFEESYPANTLLHITGHPDGTAWAASAQDPAAHMIYGPYTYSVPMGEHVAAFRISIDNNSADNGVVAIVDVADGSTGAWIATRELRRREWVTTNHYEVFELPFTLGPEHAGRPIEFRVYHAAIAYLRVEKVGYRQGGL